MYWVKLFEGKWKGLSRKCDRGTKVSGFFRIVKRKSTILLNSHQVFLTFFYPYVIAIPAKHAIAYSKTYKLPKKVLGGL
jgi:hypothetical protein